MSSKLTIHILSQNYHRWFKLIPMSLNSERELEQLAATAVLSRWSTSKTKSN